MNWWKVWTVASGVVCCGGWVLFTAAVWTNTFEVLDRGGGPPPDFVVVRDAMATWGFGFAMWWAWRSRPKPDHTPNEKG